MLNNLVTSVTNFVASFGYMGIFILMLLESANVPIPSEAIMPFGGYLVATGQLAFWPVVLVGTLGNLAGSLISYAIARYGGRPLIEKYGRYILLNKEHLDLADRWFEHHGMVAVFIGRLLPVIRTFISFPAGLAKVRVSTFSLVTFFGALPFVAFLTWIGMKLGQNWEHLSKYFHIVDAVIVVAIIGVLIWLVRRSKKK